MTSYGQTLLTIDNVNFDYNGKMIIKGLSAEIKDIISDTQTRGQITGFLGPSGVGKSTLLRLLSGLETPRSGRIAIYGQDHSIKPGDVGIVFQSYPLLNHRTVLTNLMLAASKKYPITAEAKERVIYYLNEFNLADHIHDSPKNLSGGQRQRVAIIQQILCSEHFLLMDEPFSGLDLVNLEIVFGIIRKVADLDELNTIIVVTHDINSACAISDHLWLMGWDRDPQGAKIPGAYIKQTYDLVERGLCWDPKNTEQPQFDMFLHEVKNTFKTL